MTVVRAPQAAGGCLRRRHPPRLRHGPGRLTRGGPERSRPERPIGRLPDVHADLRVLLPRRTQSSVRVPNADSSCRLVMRRWTGTVQTDAGRPDEREGVLHGFQATDKAARARCRGGGRSGDSSPRGHEGRGAAAGRRPGTCRRPAGPGACRRQTRRNMRPLRRTRPTRSSTSHSCTPRARSPTKSSPRPRRKYSGPERMPDCQKMPNRSIPGRNRG